MLYMARRTTVNPKALDNNQSFGHSLFSMSCFFWISTISCLILVLQILGRFLKSPKSNWAFPCSPNANWQTTCKKLLWGWGLKVGATLSAIGWLDPIGDGPSACKSIWEGGARNVVRALLRACFFFSTGYNKSSKKPIFSLILDCEIALNNLQQYKIHIQSHSAPTGVRRQVNFAMMPLPYAGVT